MSKTQTPDEATGERPAGSVEAKAGRSSALRRGLKAILIFVFAVVGVLFAALLVLPHANDVRALQGTLAWLSPVFALAYGVCLVLVWTRGVPFVNWLARRRGVPPPPLQAAKAARNCLAALLLVMELTVLLHWLGGSVR